VSGERNDTADRQQSAAVQGDQGWVTPDGRRCWTVDVAGMSPLYREIYRRVFPRRLAFWGVAVGRDAVVSETERSLVISGPDTLMQASRPATVALERVEAGDLAWVGWLEGSWRQHAARLEGLLRRLWAELQENRVCVELLEAVVDAKAALTAIGADGLLPSARLAGTWLRPHVAPHLLDDLLDGLYLPASGRLAYDVLELECWRLAAALGDANHLPEAVRRAFVVNGLFLHYDALNTSRKAYWLHRFPRETARRHRATAPSPAELSRRMQEVCDRSWHRRLHRQWVQSQLSGLPAGVAARLDVLHHLVGTARDYDEEKRRLNAGLWRALFALADGLGVTLTPSQGTLADLCGAVRTPGRRLRIDTVFQHEEAGESG
jgi:hypothetical protein